MEPDKKTETAEVVGYFCVGFDLLLLLGAIFLLTTGRSEPGLILLIASLCLLPIGIVNVVQGRSKSTPAA